jgi:hypothetical protein
MIYRDGVGVIVKGGNLDIGRLGPASCRSELAAPMVIRDQMDAIIHPVTGHPMESKRAFEAATKAADLVRHGAYT